MDALTRLISERIYLAREEAGLSQDALSAKLGFNDRQTLSAIETGLRRVSPEELVLLSQKLDQPLEYFTDPYVVAEKSSFSYRATKPAKSDLAAFEQQAERLISANRRFRELLGETPSPVQPQLTELTKGMPLDFATWQGEQTAAAWQLGEIPALRLRDAAETTLGITILFVDAPASISGAACRLRDGGVILINRNEPVSRQNFDLGHELFHLLTWDRMPPERIDLITSEGTAGRSKVEKLADAYTAGLLMPQATIQRRWSQRNTQTTEAWIRAQARELRVSPLALYWRLVNLELVDPKDISAKSIPAAGTNGAESRPNLYSAGFVTRLHKVLDRGHVTVLKAAELLDFSVDELQGLFSAYKLNAPFDL